MAGWLTPVLIGLTAILLGRAHYMLYILKRGNRWSMAITWVATFLVIGFWSWRWFA